MVEVPAIGFGDALAGERAPHDRRRRVQNRKRQARPAGPASSMAMACLPSPMIVTVAKTKPMNSDPASPKKDARRIEIVRKEAERRRRPAPSSTSATTGLVCRIEITKMTTAEIVATPESRPSRPSMKLIAFIIPTYHTSVSGTPTYQGNSIQLVVGIVVERVGRAVDDEAVQHRDRRDDDLRDELVARSASP